MFYKLGLQKAMNWNYNKQQNLILLENDFIRHLILLDYLNLGRDLYVATKCLKYFPVKFLSILKMCSAFNPSWESISEPYIK